MMMGEPSYNQQRPSVPHEIASSAPALLITFAIAFQRSMTNEDLNIGRLRLERQRCIKSECLKKRFTIASKPLRHF